MQYAEFRSEKPFVYFQWKKRKVRTPQLPQCGRSRNQNESVRTGLQTRPTPMRRKPDGSGEAVRTDSFVAETQEN